MALPSLSEDDLKLIGAFIQIYNFMELNLRRSIEAAAKGGLLPHLSEKKLRSLQPSDLVPAMKAAVANMNLSDEERGDTLQKLDEIELRRGHRNLFAHWAARRIGDDGIVFITRNDRDAAASGRPLADGAVATAIMQLADIRGLTRHMLQYEVWIAQKTSELYSKYVGE
jgi:hypothetical protein